MPEWSMRLLLISGVLVTVAVAMRAFRVLQAFPQPGLVKGSPSGAAAGVLALVGSAGFGIVGVFLSDLSAPGQFLPWLALVMAFAVAGAACLFLCTGIIARYDSVGMEVRTWRRRWRRAPWRDVRKLRLDLMGSSVVFELHQHGKLSLPQDASGLSDLIEAARKSGVRGAAGLLGVDEKA